MFTSVETDVDKKLHVDKKLADFDTESMNNNELLLANLKKRSKQLTSLLMNKIVTFYRKSNQL